MRIAVVGSGVSGLTTAWMLKRHHQVTLFEKSDRLGGHSNTVDVAFADQNIAVDTGFIVFNDANYPNFRKFIDHLGVRSEESDMSFSVSLDRGQFEYCGTSLRTLLAQPSNLVNPRFWALLKEIVRFNTIGRREAQNARPCTLSLSGFLDNHRFSNDFRDRYLLPMAAAIWSAPTKSILDFPTDTLIRFFDNHALLGANGHHVWHTLSGRSRDYVQRLEMELGSSVQRNARIIAAKRSENGVEIVDSGGHRSTFDHLVLACHADQTVPILMDADEREYAALGAFKFLPNTAVLHSDVSFMPKRKATWASWNYQASKSADRAANVCVTYWMNRLQNIDPSYPLFVTMNPKQPPREDLVHATFRYDHPTFDMTAMQAQKIMPHLQGYRRTWYAGAWLGSGFHEDGINSALAVAQGFGIAPPWKPQTGIVGSGFGLPERAVAFRP